MNSALVDRIAKAVLYEGYMLYPYRTSAIKNRQRFNFGVVYPKAYCEAQGSGDSYFMQTQCVIVGREATRVSVRVRFLRMTSRIVQRCGAPVEEIPGSDDARLVRVDRLEVQGKTYRPWQEAAEEEIELNEFCLGELISRPMPWPFRLSAEQENEIIRDEEGRSVGMISRAKRTLSGTIECSAEKCSDGLFRVAVNLTNTTSTGARTFLDRECALESALVSAHMVLETHGGEFVSMTDPPEDLQEQVSKCRNIGLWPVLAGEEGQRETILSAPIILYDYPQVAPESPGDLFDGAEIDEILSLRILTMTEEEKAEVRESDDRVRQILERTEGLPEEHFRKLHGAMRPLGTRTRGATP